MHKTRASASQIDPVQLTQIVEKMLGNGPVRIQEWHTETLTGGMEQHSAVVRCRGLAENGGRIFPWSLIIKKFSPDDQHDDPAGFRYWKREVLAFQSGFFDQMPGYLAAPRCFKVENYPDRSVWVWMEDAANDSEGEWTMEIYADVARMLGQFNGTYLAGTPLPGEDWVTRGWLRKYVENASPMVDFIRCNPDHPLVKSLYGSNLAFIFAFWEVRHDLLDVLDEMPQVFCHQDAFKRNLFIQKGKLLGIDWGYAGFAPPGSEIVPLVAVAHEFGNFPIERIRELDSMCFQTYLDGLKQQSIRISSRQVRRCYTFTLLLRYLLGANIGEVLPLLMDESKHQWLEEGYQRPAEETSKTDPETGKYYFSIFLEALRLMGIKPLLKIIWYTLKFSMNKKQFSVEKR